RDSPRSNEPASAQSPVFDVARPIAPAQSPQATGTMVVAAGSAILAGLESGQPLGTTGDGDCGLGGARPVAARRGDRLQATVVVAHDPRTDPARPQCTVGWRAAVPRGQSLESSDRRSTGVSAVGEANISDW